MSATHRTPIERLTLALAEIEWEAIFLDDVSSVGRLVAHLDDHHAVSPRV